MDRKGRGFIKRKENQDETFTDSPGPDSVDRFLTRVLVVVREIPEANY